MLFMNRRDLLKPKRAPKVGLPGFDVSRSGQCPE